MSNEERRGADPHGPSPNRGTLVRDLYRRWASLDRGWQAICLSSVLVLAVAIGLPIPW